MSPADIQRQEIDQEQRSRNTAWLGLPEVVCGEPLHNITPYLLGLLEVIRSPFICGASVIRRVDVVQFIWAMSIHYRKPSRLDIYGWRHRRRIRNSVARINLADAVRDIEAFIELTFMDAPPSSGKPERPIASDVSWLVYRFRFDPWRFHDEKTLYTPLRLLYQDLRCWKAENTKEYITNKSDRHSGDFWTKVFGALERGEITQEQFLAWKKKHGLN